MSSMTWAEGSQAHGPRRKRSICLTLTNVDESKHKHPPPTRPKRSRVSNDKVGGHQSQGAPVSQSTAGQSMEGHRFVHDTECSPSAQPAQSTDLSSHAKILQIQRSFRRTNLLKKVEEISRNKKIPSYPRKSTDILTALVQFVGIEDKANDEYIESLRLKIQSLGEEIVVLTKDNKMLRKSNHDSRVVSVARLEADRISVDKVELALINSREEQEAAQLCLDVLKRGLNNSLQQVKQKRSGERPESNADKYKPGQAKGDEHINLRICGSYSDDAATPYLLQSALSLSRVAVTRLQKVYFEDFRKRTGRRCTGEHLNTKIFFGRPTDSAYYVKSLLSTTLFHGFENESFDTSCGATKFLNPNLRQRNFFEYYLRERERPYADDIDDPQYKEFCEGKVSLLLCNIGHICNEERLEASDLDPELALSFRAAARSVWLLHKLAFSFEPPASIFRVEVGGDVDPEYMETVVDIDDSESFVSKVGFIIAPGLRIRKTVMRCEVYLAGGTSAQLGRRPCLNST